VIRIGIAVSPGFVDEQKNSASQSLVTRCDDPTFARRDMLALLQAEAANRADRTDVLITVRRQVRLSTIFDDGNSMRLASSMIGPISQGFPNRCVTMIAFVLGLMQRAMVAAVTL
jgi:hypothetical protein